MYKSATWINWNYPSAANSKASRVLIIDLFHTLVQVDRAIGSHSSCSI